MCGIIGKTGAGDVVPALVAGLKTLEYRGYDSAGVAVQTPAGFDRVRSVGKIADLEAALRAHPLAGTAGVGHTRWATHGEPSVANAHPHYSPNGLFTVVHNGIIENAEELKAEVLPPDAVYASETDTETVAHLLEKFYTGDPVAAIAETQEYLRGSYALGVLCADYPGVLFAAAMGSPLIAARAADGLYIASDVCAVPGAKEIFRLKNGEIAALRGDKLRFFTAEGVPTEKKSEKAAADALIADKGDYEHYMLFEIMQQPEAVRRTLLPLLRDGRPDLNAFGLSEDYIRDGLREIVIVACGSAYHTGLAAKRLLESLARVPCRAEIASEFRYADPVIDGGTLAVFVSQSGETADTLAALRLAKEKGAKTLSIVNVAGSAIAAESDCVIPTRAGREVAVATTKAYSAQLAVFYALTVRVARLRGRLDDAEEARLTHALAGLPDLIEETIRVTEPVVRTLAEEIFEKNDMFFIGRQLDDAAAAEASLKMKEISYLNAQAYAAGELKHGTISLVEPGTPVIALAADAGTAGKTRANLAEVKARGAFTVAVTTRSQRAAFAAADRIVTVPDADRLLVCSLAVVPMQLLSYYTAKRRGCSIDQPKNLAKSVTVE